MLLNNIFLWFYEQKQQIIPNRNSTYIHFNQIHNLKDSFTFECVNETDSYPDSNVQLIRWVQFF